jgi:hypothetical protein
MGMAYLNRPNCRKQLFISTGDQGQCDYRATKPLFLALMTDSWFFIFIFDYSQTSRERCPRSPDGGWLRRDGPDERYIADMRPNLPMKRPLWRMAEFALAMGSSIHAQSIPVFEN